ncbi:MAG TPA: Re/Si-specific NAD(P)(+) transhydrogenase subunit alpha [Candidatus Hydrogenedentes bacterium]|nr:Re/Si-specific NAD(P)(+) transhydrogenase subunit alpha [Candidatus Hydrogenedentota bacterium]
MLIYVPKETWPGERRVPLVPDTVAKLAKKGAEITVEAGMGAPCGFTDEAYEKAGAKVTQDGPGTLAAADAVLRLRKPSPEFVKAMKPGSLLVSYLEPFTDADLLDTIIAAKVDAICMEMIPRTTLAQKMDALSSQANLAGYVAVMAAANKLSQVLPMMMTPAGTLKPARVFIIGVGVAGLQAIATAKRLGARVEAFDTRPVVEEQVQSLGAKFVKIDLGETGQTKDGYAVELTEEQKERQKEAMAKVIAQSDIVITTAQVFGRKAPVIVTRAMVESMRPGSVVVDLAAETGGNVEGSQPGAEVDINGVTVMGAENFPGRVPVHASQMYSANVGNLVEHFWDKDAGAIKLNTDDEIMNGCLIVRDGELRSEMLKKARAAK